MLNRELEHFESSIEKLGKPRLKAALKSFNLATIEDLLADIGLGVRPAPLVARSLIGNTPDTPTTHGKKGRGGRTNRREAPGPLLIHGTEGMVVTIPKCCYPIPGDPIMGSLTAGRGIVIHHPSCKNVINFRSAPDKWVDVEWAADIDREFSAEIVLDVVNQRGVLATVAAACAAESANIEGIELSERDEHYSNMHLIIGVKDRTHLANVLRVLRNIKTVVRVHRKRA